MPQIEQLAATIASQAFWLLIVFGILYFGIAKTMLPKVGRAVEGREARIAEDLKAAQAARDSAASAQSGWEGALAKAQEEARATLASVTAQAQADTAAHVAAADAGIALRLASAEAELAAARRNALGQVNDIAVEAAVGVVAKLTGTTPSTDQARAMVTAARNVEG